MIMCSMYLQARNIKSLSFPLDTSYQPHQVNEQWPSLKAPLEIYNDVLEKSLSLTFGFNLMLMSTISYSSAVIDVDSCCVIFT